MTNIEHATSLFNYEKYIKFIVYGRNGNVVLLEQIVIIEVAH